MACHTIRTHCSKGFILVKGLFSSQPLSTLLRRQHRGYYDCKSGLAVVTKIKYRNKEIISIDSSKAEEESSIFIIKKMEITDDGEKVYFTGT